MRVPTRAWAAALGGAVLFAASAGAQQGRFSLDSDRNEVDTGDHVTLQSDVLSTPPYNQGEHEVWIWFCPDTLENCRQVGRWRRLPATDDTGNPKRPLEFYVCTRNPCRLRVRLSKPREAKYTFVAAVYRAGQRVAQAKPLVVAWTKKVTPPKPPDGTITLKLTVNGVSCTAKVGANPPSSKRYKENLNRCVLESPNGVTRWFRYDGGRLRWLDKNGKLLQLYGQDGKPLADKDGKPVEGALVATAEITGLKQPQWWIMFSWAGQQIYCDGNENPCTRTLTDLNPDAWERGEFLDRALVGVQTMWDHKKGERGVSQDFPGLQAEIGIDYRPRK